MAMPWVRKGIKMLIDRQKKKMQVNGLRAGRTRAMVEELE